MGKFEYVTLFLKFCQTDEGRVEFLQYADSISDEEKDRQNASAIAVLELAEKVDKAGAIRMIRWIGEEFYRGLPDMEAIAEALRALIEAIPEDSDG